MTFGFASPPKAGQSKLYFGGLRSSKLINSQRAFKKGGEDILKEYKPIFVWVVIVGGLLWGYEGVTGTNLLISVLGASIASIVEIVVGVAALALAYMKLAMSGKK